MKTRPRANAPAAADHRVTCRLGLTYRPISALKPDPLNPRIHRPHQIRQIARSMQAFGFNVPILIDHQNRVIAGHGRLLACQTLGWREVPTISLTHLTETQARAFMLADNKLCDNATWDDRLLATQLKALAEVDLDFHLDATGFEMGEIDLLIEGLSPASAETDDPADRLPDLPPQPPVSQRGDVWLLGRHRMLCGSALDEVAYQAVMEQTRAAMVLTDPPYNVPIPGHASGLGRRTHRDFVMASGEMTPAEFTRFLADACRLLARFSSPSALAYVFMDWRHVAELLAAGRTAFAELTNLCVWDKGTGGMGSLYRSQHELVFVFKAGTAPHRNNVQLGQYGRYRTNVWQYPGINSFGRTTEEGNLLVLHPTVKPVALVADAILDASARNDVVLDAFLGSGTTIIAAERTGRLCYGMDLDPLYVDTAIRRWQAWTGQQARHARSGMGFDDVAAEKGRGHGPQAHSRTEP